VLLVFLRMAALRATSSSCLENGPLFSLEVSGSLTKGASGDSSRRKALRGLLPTAESPRLRRGRVLYFLGDLKACFTGTGYM